MFRFLSALFLAIYILDITVQAYETRRVWVMYDIFLKRRRNPLGYWLMTLFWSALSAFCLVGILFLLYQAINSSGPYREHAFFSLHQAWPYGLTALIAGLLAGMIIRDRLHMLKVRT
jgi:uncharacterized integral membrane protein